MPSAGPLQSLRTGPGGPLLPLPRPGGPVATGTLPPIGAGIQPLRSPTSGLPPIGTQPARPGQCNFIRTFEDTYHT